jgi:hypothetical protein
MGSRLARTLKIALIVLVAFVALFALLYALGSSH